MNYEQKSTSSDQGHGYQEKLVLKRVRENVPRLSIYILNIYSTLLAAQAIFIVMA
jgi:hypothetical protein